MTIRNTELNRRLGYLQNCAEKAPEGTYEEAKRAAAAVDQAIESVRTIFRDHGFAANGTDPCRDLEASIYGFLLVSNPNAYGLLTGEGFGEHVDGPAGERVLANAIRDRDVFKVVAEHLHQTIHA
jgi:hypothetical protein